MKEPILGQPRVVRIALAQMLVEGGQKRANLKRAENNIAHAAERGAEIVVLPETLNLGWTHPSAVAEAGAIPGGESFERLRAAAISKQLYVCAGLAERDADKVFNSAVLISPQGEILLVH